METDVADDLNRVSIEYMRSCADAYIKWFFEHLEPNHDPTKCDDCVELGLRIKING